MVRTHRAFSHPLYMTWEHVSAPLDLMAELEDDDPSPKKQVATVTAPNPTQPEPREPLRGLKLDRQLAGGIALMGIKHHLDALADH